MTTTLNEEQLHVLQQVARFEPITFDELKAVTPKISSYKVEKIAREVEDEGWLERSGDTLSLSSRGRPTPDEGQQSLNGEKVSDTAVKHAELPEAIDTDQLALNLSEEQAFLFEQMRADVSRNCGYQSTEEFIDWILREARRMTEV